MTTSNENIFSCYWRFVRVIHRALVNSPRKASDAELPVTRSFHVVFDLRLNKCFSKQSRGWWFETPSHSLWRHCNAHNEEAGDIYAYTLRK